MKVLKLSVATLLLLSLNSIALAQPSKKTIQSFVRLRGDSVYYCLSEPLIFGLIDAFWVSQDAKANEDKVIELETQVTHWQTRTELLELNIEQLELIVAAKDTIIEVADDVTELNEKEVKRLKRQAVAKWFKSTLGMLATGVTGVGVGIGIGVMVGR